MAFALRRASSLLLREWEQSGAFAADLIDLTAHKNRLDPRDRAALQRLVYAVIRHQRLLDEVIRSLVRDRPDALTRRLLRMGLAELLLLDGAPHAVVHETVSLAGRNKALVNAVLRRALRESAVILASWETLPPDVRWSVPQFLWQRWITQFGPECSIRLAQWNQEPAPVYLRLHPPQGVDLDFAKAQVTPVPGYPAYVRADGQFPRDWLEDGWAYAQDPSTQAAVDHLALLPGNSVLDACAAPGGKTLAIVQSGATGRICATDQSPDRLLQLRQNLQRLRLDSTVETTLQNWREAASPDLMDRRFDRILIDAPCSNTGVIRRRIDVPWRLRAEDFTSLPKTQLALLEQVSRHLAQDGKLVYSTCSLDRDENENVVQAFLASHPEFRLISETRVLPWIDGLDGAYSAALTKGPS